MIAGASQKCLHSLKVQKEAQMESSDSANPVRKVINRSLSTLLNKVEYSHKYRNSKLIIN